MDTKIRSLKIEAGEAKNLSELCQRLVETYGAGLVSIIAYGSSVAGGYEPRISDINLVLVLQRAGLEQIRKAAPLIKRSGLKLSLRFFDPGSLEALADAYPLELRDMQIAHVLIHGRDVLSELDLDAESVRRECRRALTGVATRIRHQALAAGDDAKALAALASDTLRAILAVFRHLLRLEGKQIPASKEDLIKMAASDYRFDSQPFLRVLALRGESASNAEIAQAFADCFEAVQSIAARAGEIVK
jgi:hypothetical protein